MRWLHASGTSVDTGLSASADGLAEGWTIGGNMGVFVDAAPSTLVGAMMSLEVRDAFHSCTTGSATPEMCTSNEASATLLGFAFGLML